MLLNPRKSIPFVTIVIDSYNYAPFLGQAIDSCLRQTYPRKHFEIIVIDDGSTDGSADVAASYGSQIQLIRKSNGGQASAFNLGVEAAKGDIVCFLDADDYFYANKLLSVTNTFDSDPRIGVVYNRYDVVSSDGRILFAKMPKRLKRGDLAGRTLLGFVSGSPSSGISAQRSVLAQLPIPEEHFKISADFFYLTLLPLITLIGTVESSVHAYRVHENNAYLARPPEGRRNIHQNQSEVIRVYAETKLGQRFFSGLEPRPVSGGTSSGVTAQLSAALRQLQNIRAPLLLKAWTMSKVLAYSLSTGTRYLALQERWRKYQASRLGW